MPQVIKQTVFGYGLTTLRTLPEQGKIIAVGDSGAAKLFQLDIATKELNEVQSIEPSDSELCSALAVDPNGKYFICATEDCSVDRFSLEDGSFMDHIARLSSSLRCIDISPNGNLAAIASEDKTIKLVNLMDTSQVTSLKGHIGPVKHLQFDPQGLYLVSSGCDGIVRIFNTKDTTQKHISLSRLAKSKITDELIHECSWHPDGTSIAIPSDESIAIIAIDSWTVKFQLTKDCHEGPVSIVQWSPNGRYIASAGIDMKVMVWDVDTKELINSTQVTKPVTSMHWNSSSDTIYTANWLGELVVWSHPVLSHILSIENSEGTKRGLEGSSEHKRRKLRKLIEVDDEPRIYSEDDLDNEENFSIDSDISPIRHVSPPRHQLLFPSQSPVQQGSTSEQSKNRLLSWNLFGSVTSQSTETHSIVLIEFADVSFYRPIRFTDHFGFSMATMNERGAFMASKKKVTDGPSSMISFKPFDNWASNSDWRMSLGSEEAVCLAIGDKWVAVGTSMGFVRVFSLAGRQVWVFSVAGDCVSVCGYGDQLCCVFQSGMRENSVSLSYVLVKVSGCVKVSEGLLPLSPVSKLEWIGYSENGILTAIDTTGIVRGLLTVQNYSWIPLLDARNHVDDEHTYLWPVGVTNSEVMYAPCKNGRREPFISPLPLLKSVKFEVPLVGTSKSIQMEGSHLLLSTMVSEIVHRKGIDTLGEKVMRNKKGRMDQIILKLIQEACADDNQFKALDLATSLHLDKSLEIAKTLASKSNQAVLLEKLDLMEMSRRSIKNDQ